MCGIQVLRRSTPVCCALVPGASCSVCFVRPQHLLFLAQPTMMSAVGWLFEATCSMFYLKSPSHLALDDSDPPPRFLLEHGIPMFFIMIMVEAGVSAVLRAWRSRQGTMHALGVSFTPRYRLNDFVACATLGSLQRVFQLLVELLDVTVHVGGYRFVYDHFRLFTIAPKSNVLLSYICLMLGKDLAYYWAHRFMHEFHVVWLTHSVHHSGQDYNLATGLRQGVFQPFFTWLFYLPLALLGFHPAAFSAHAQLNTLYMYWIHTDLVNRLPWPLEYILNTPMAHRMHHRPPGNCNYAGMFIVWDRLFGTYVAEVDRKDYYGLAHAPQTFDAVVLNCQHAQRMAQSHAVRLCQQRRAAATANACKAADSPPGPSTVAAAMAAQAPRASWHWGWVLRRRVPARWVCDWHLLFHPIPPPGRDLRRAKNARLWDGETSLCGWRGAGVLLCMGGTLVGAVVLLVRAARMHRADAVLATAVTCASLVLINRACDQRKVDGQAPLAACALLVLLLSALLSLQPCAQLGLGRVGDSHMHADAHGNDTSLPAAAGAM